MRISEFCVVRLVRVVEKVSTLVVRFVIWNMGVRWMIRTAEKKVD